MTYESYEPYILQHSANEIDNKLNLINENKNLLPYPYKVDGNVIEFPDGLKNVGDGSILVTAAAGQDLPVTQLGDPLTLPAGTYTVSFETVDVLDTAKQVSVNYSNTNTIKVFIYINNEYYTDLCLGSDLVVINLDQESTIELTLSNYADGQSYIIRPQIEAGSEKTPWVPYMKDIGSYVDERFNSLNTRFNTVIKNTAETGVTAEVNTIKLGSVVLTEAQLQKILNFIDTVELS